MRGLLAALAVLLATAAQAAPSVTVYRHAALIDGTGGPLRPDMAVVVEGERIAAVGPDAEVATPPGARVVDLTGKYVTPGLIDSHQHIATPPDRRQAEAALRRNLYGGVTSIRVMADDLRAVAELARASRAAEIPAPEITFAALMAGESFFADPRVAAASRGFAPGTAPWMQAVTATTDLPLAVARARGTGATAIKIYANLPPDLVTAIAAEARRQGLAVWIHGAVFPTTPDEGLGARPDTVSHTCYLAYEVAGVPPSYQARTVIDPAPFMAGDNPVMAGLFARMKGQGTLLDATLRVYAEGDRRAAADPKARRPFCATALAAVLTRQAWLAGVELSAGTDGLAPWNDRWPELHDELALLAKDAGLPAAAVIRAATLGGARASGREAETGTIAPGKLADLLILARNPLDDVANFKSLEVTVKRGRPYSRTDYRPLRRRDLED